MGKNAPVPPIRLVGLYSKRTLNLCDKLTYEGTKIAIDYAEFAHHPLTHEQYGLCYVTLHRELGPKGIYEYRLGDVRPEGLNLIDHFLTNEARRAVKRRDREQAQTTEAAHGGDESSHA